MKGFKITPVRGKSTALIPLLVPADLSRQPAKEVKDIKTLIATTGKMAAALIVNNWEGDSKRSEGAALAHHQVEKDHQAFFMVRPDIARTHFEKDDIIINPEILELIGEPVPMKEACLSHPWKPWRHVQRHEKVKARWENAAGETITRTLEGIAAQIFQHELDHLQGKTIWS